MNMILRCTRIEQLRNGTECHVLFEVAQGANRGTAEITVPVADVKNFVVGQHYGGDLLPVEFTPAAVVVKPRASSNPRPPVRSLAAPVQAPVQG